jgi:tetratricopeptide (TPR) repeat protein
MITDLIAHRPTPKAAYTVIPMPSFRKAIAIDPEFCAALNDLGASYLETDQIDLAIEQFNKAVAIDPHAPKPYANLAIAYLGMGEYADAERAARRVIDLDRAGTHGHLALGVSLVLQNKYTPLRRAVNYRVGQIARVPGVLAIRPDS